MKATYNDRLKVSLSGLTLSSPLLPASGTFGYGYEVVKFNSKYYFGALITKGLSLRPREGNRPPRIKETPCGLINSIGLENPGLEVFMENILPVMKDVGLPIIVNLAGHDVNEFLEMIELLNSEEKIVGYEINISCPNVSLGGLEFFYNKGALRELLSEVRQMSRKINIVKIPPDIFHFKEIVDIVLQEGFRILTVANTYPAMYLDIENVDFYFERKFGGLSGPAIYPLTLRLVYLIKKEFPEVQIIASGGVYNANVALQYVLCGASLIEIGAASFINPNIARDVYEGILNYLDQKGFYNLEEIVGLVHRM
ncbi:MAG: dihydroorotate dehydrogenase [candidate division WOR-3 bacterium]